MESKQEDLVDMDTAIAYAQLALHTLKKSATEITPNELRNEIKMLYKKFGAKEVKQLANIIVKGKK